MADEIHRQSEVAPPAPAAQEREQSARLMRLLSKGVRRFASDVPKALSGRDPKAVHDLRVWSRRLQQMMLAAFGDAEPKKARAIRKTLKRVRRELGSWRNSDVMLQILGERERHARSEAAIKAWTLVREMAQGERKREIRSARKRLLKLDLFGLTEDVEDLIHDGVTAKGSVRDETRKAYQRWHAALDAAAREFNAAEIHKFRICTKRLRYQTELMRELGESDTAPQHGGLKELQDGLGRWRDQVELGNTISRAVADPETVLNEPRISIILLTELEKLKRSADNSIRDLLGKVSGGDESAHFEAWIKCSTPAAFESGPAAPESIPPSGQSSENR